MKITHHALRILAISSVEFHTNKGEPTELIHQVAPLRNSGFVPSTASVPLPRYADTIHYFQHLLIHVAYAL